VAELSREQEAPVDLRAVMHVVGATLNELNDGVGQRRLLTDLVTAADRFGGGISACFTVVEPEGGRVVVTSPAGAWIQGRQFSWEGSALASLLAGTQASRTFELAEAAPAVQADLRLHGIGSVLMARAITSGSTVGAIEVFYGHDRPPPDEQRRQVVELFASACCSVLVTGNAGLDLDTAREWGDGPTVAAAIADGLAVLGAGGRVRSWNRAARQLTGLRRESALHREPPFPVPEPGQVLDHRLDSGRWIQILCSPLEGIGERVVTFRDITRPKMLEEEKDLFLATTGHELRTPLTVVKGYAETLSNRWVDLDDEQRLDAIEVIRQRTEQLANLVERLLMGSRPAGEPVRVTCEPFDLRRAVISAATGLVEPASAHQLVLDLPDDLPAVLGDRASIDTVVGELVTNAVKYSPDGGEISVTAGYDGSTVVFRVADRGIGVRHEHVEQVFGRFWQREAGDQRRFGGVGLGLYIIRRLIDQQNGWVSLHPRDGGGTVVEVRLPRADVSAQARGPKL
jgi:signal transduction histidine kinase